MPAVRLLEMGCRDVCVDFGSPEVGMAEHRALTDTLAPALFNINMYYRTSAFATGCAVGLPF
jgi:hypothetical protein